MLMIMRSTLMHLLTYHSQLAFGNDRCSFGGILTLSVLEFHKFFRARRIQKRGSNTRDTFCPGGTLAISRWLSGAPPPVTVSNVELHPGRMRASGLQAAISVHGGS